MSCPRVQHFVCTCHRVQHSFSVHVLWFSMFICIAMCPAFHTSSGSAFLSRMSWVSTFLSHIPSFAQFLGFRNCAHSSSFVHVFRTSGSALLYHIASGSTFFISHISSFAHVLGFSLSLAHFLGFYISFAQFLGFSLYLVHFLGFHICLILDFKWNLHEARIQKPPASLSEKCVRHRF